MSNEITIKDIKLFFSLSNKVELLAVKCVDKLIQNNKSFSYSNNTNKDWSPDTDKDLNASGLNRCGKYFRINNKDFWFLGITLGKCDNYFCLAFKGKIKANDFERFEGDSWSYCKVPDVILNTSSEQKQLVTLVEFVKKKIRERR